MSVSVVNDKKIILNFTDTSISVDKIEENTVMQPIDVIAYRIHAWIYNTTDKNHNILDVKELAKSVFVNIDTDDDSINDKEKKEIKIDLKADLLPSF